MMLARSAWSWAKRHALWSLEKHSHPEELSAEAEPPAKQPRLEVADDVVMQPADAEAWFDASSDPMQVDEPEVAWPGSFEQQQPFQPDATPWPDATDTSAAESGVHAEQPLWGWAQQPWQQDVQEGGMQPSSGNSRVAKVACSHAHCPVCGTPYRKQRSQKKSKKAKRQGSKAGRRGRQQKGKRQKSFASEPEPAQQQAKKPRGRPPRRVRLQRQQLAGATDGPVELNSIVNGPPGGSKEPAGVVGANSLVFSPPSAIPQRHERVHGHLAV